MIQTRIASHNTHTPHTSLEIWIHTTTTTTTIIIADIFWHPINIAENNDLKRNFLSNK